MTDSGFLNVLIPEEFGGSGLGLIEACAVLEEVSLNGAHAGACHAQMYIMGTVLRHGNEEQKIKLQEALKNGNSLPIEEEVIDFWNNLKKSN